MSRVIDSFVQAEKYEKLRSILFSDFEDWGCSPIEVLLREGISDGIFANPLFVENTLMNFKNLENSVNRELRNFYKSQMDKGSIK